MSTSAEEIRAALDKARKLADRGDAVMRGSARLKVYEEAEGCLAGIDASEEAAAFREALGRKKQMARVSEITACYQRALRNQNTARTSEDWNSAAGRYKEVCRMKENWFPEGDPAFTEQLAQIDDAADRAAACRRKAVGKIRISRVWIMLLVLAAVVGAYGYRTSTFHNLVGDTEMVLGLSEKASAHYERAWKRNRTPGNYRRYLSACYACGMKALAEGRYADAVGELELPQTEGYEDADFQRTRGELLAMREAEPGESVTFGDGEWVILDRSGDSVLLMRMESLAAEGFQQDRAGKAQWAESSVRTYLNETYPEKAFSPEERACILETEVPAEDNPIYGTDGGEDTRDRLFLISISEYEKYREQINESRKSYWMRVPGAEEGTMAFVAYRRCIMDYGYDAADPQINVRPLMWISTDGVENVQ